MQRLLAFSTSLVGLALGLLILGNGASSLLAGPAPEVAVRINPFNVEAAIATALAGLSSGDPAAAQQTAAGLEAALSYAPADARLYSMIGIANETAGDIDKARQRYGQALRLLPTEIQALLHLIALDINAGNIAAAVANTDRLARRWPEQWSLLDPYLPAMLSSDAGMDAFVDIYRNSPIGQARLINSLVANPDSVELTLPLLLRWKEIGASVNPDQVNRATTALIRAGKPAAAYALFLQMLTDEERKHGGYVHNGAFALPVGRTSPFNWTIRDQAGVNIERIISGDRNILEARFLDNPLQFDNIIQALRLPAGRYVLSVVYSADSLSTPKPITAVVECGPRKNQVASIVLSQGTAAETPVETEFEIPFVDCDLAYLRFKTDYISLSFQNRFSGKLRLHEVRIKRLGN